MTPQHAWFIAEGRTWLSTYNKGRVRTTQLNSLGRAELTESCHSGSHTHFRSHTRMQALSLISGMQSFELSALAQPGWARWLSAMTSTMRAQ